MPLHNKHLHPRCPLLSNAKIPKIQFFSSLGESKMANMVQKEDCRFSITTIGIEGRKESK